MRTGRAMAELILSAEERSTLEGWVRRRHSAPALALRAGIVLDCAGGLTNTVVARRRHVSKQMVGKWRSRFVRHRVGGLLDEPRCGAPRTVEDAHIESVLVRTLESVPRDATHWSTRAMAQASGLSHMTVQRIWKAFGLEPHRSQTFKLSSDPQFVEKVRDIVGLYLHPPERAVVLCWDEKTQIQALDGSQGVLPCVPARRSGEATIISVMVRPRCLRPWMPRREKSWADCIAATARWSSASSSTPSRRQCLREWRCISFWTITARIKRRSSGSGWLSVRTITCTLRPPERRGSTWWSVSLRCSRKSRSGAAFTAAPANWNKPYGIIWRLTTKRPSLSFGPKPPTKSWPAWPVFVSELQLQDTRIARSKIDGPYPLGET